MTSLPSSLRIEPLCGATVRQLAFQCRNEVTKNRPMNLEEALHWRSTKSTGPEFVLRTEPGSAEGNILGYLGLGTLNLDRHNQVHIFCHCDKTVPVETFQTLLGLGTQLATRIGARSASIQCPLSDHDRLDILLRNGFRLKLRMIQLALDLSEENAPLEMMSRKPLPDGVEIMSLRDFAENYSTTWEQAYIAAEAKILTEIAAEKNDLSTAKHLVSGSINAPGFDPTLTVVALYNKEVIGFATTTQLTLDSPRLYHGLTGVVPEWRRKHLAYSLKLELIKRAVAAKKSEIWTETEVDSYLYLTNRELGFQDQSEYWHLTKRLS